MVITSEVRLGKPCIVPIWHEPVYLRDATPHFTCTDWTWMTLMSSVSHKPLGEPGITTPILHMTRMRHVTTSHSTNDRAAIFTAGMVGYKERKLR